MLKQVRFDAIFDNRSGIFDSSTSSLAIDQNHSGAQNTFKAKNTNGFDFSVDAIYIFIQLICSCLAGVYNEYLLKRDGEHVNIYVQNVFMYVDSIASNLLFLLVQGNILAAFDVSNLRSLMTFNVIIIMVNNAAIGIVTSFFLRYLNSILKTFASALELLFTAVLCFIFFGIPIYFNTILSIGVVSLAIYLYSLSPVVNTNNNQRRFMAANRQTITYANQKQSDDGVALLDTVEEV